MPRRSYPRPTVTRAVAAAVGVTVTTAAASGCSIAPRPGRRSTTNLTRKLGLFCLCFGPDTKVKMPKVKSVGGRRDFDRAE